MADTAIRESKERVKSAIKNSGFDWPQERLTISLAPSDIKKEGACFDLAIALGVLAATEQLDKEKLEGYCVLGELSLDGSLRTCHGILPISLAMHRAGLKKIILPFQDANEAAIVAQNSVWPVRSLKETVQLLHDPGLTQPISVDVQVLFKESTRYPVDFSEVKGQYLAKRALEVAVSGGHNIAMIGPPGSGKTMLAKRIPTIMPEVTLEEALEVTKVHSVTGGVPIGSGLIATRPFRSPHHSISDVALIGGGSLPQPGEISLAHRGVLFLDELPEFQRKSLEALRQPLEDGSIRVSRIFKSFTFPANFMLVAALNPCPCGYYTDPKKACRCSTTQIARYVGKISGPLLDRIDIHIEIPAIKYKELADTKDAESSSAIKERVEKARALQRKRFREDKIFYNASMNTKLIKKHCVMETEARELLRLAMDELGLSARAYDKVLKVARTIADLAGCENIQAEHISEAVQYRSLDRQW
jgi:magnesium chelatase family protein